LEQGLVHHFHGKILFNVGAFRLRVGPSPQDPFDFGEAAFANVVQDFKLIHKFFILKKI
jgi:hypothetical protein